MDKPLVYLLVLNYNNYEKTKQCIESCLTQTYSNLIINLIDNNSANNCMDLLKLDFKDSIIYTQNNFNMGYAKANNEAVRAAYNNGAKYSFIINNDTKLIGNDLVEEMVKIMEENERYGLLAPPVYTILKNGERFLEHNSPKRLKILISLGILKQDMNIGKPNRLYTGTAIGAAILLRNSYFIEVNGFPIENFMYGDEDILCIKLIKQGKNVVTLTDTSYIVEHFHDKQSTIDDWRIYLIGRNKVLEQKYFKFPENIFVGIMNHISLSFAILKRVIKLQFGSVRALILGIYDGHKHIFKRTNNDTLFAEGKYKMKQYIKNK